MSGTAFFVGLAALTAIKCVACIALDSDRSEELPRPSRID